MLRNNIASYLVGMFIVALSAFYAEGASHYSFRQLGSKDGMSASYVKSITQDANGFVWFGTKNGLDRFDGISMRTFNVYDINAQRGNNNISAIYEDVDDNLWVGTDRGVYIFNPHDESFTFLNSQSSTGVQVEDWVQTICNDKDGNIWILVPNQGVFRYKDSKIEYYSVTSHNGDKEKIPLSIIVTKDGNLYVGTNQQGLYAYDKQVNMFRKLYKDGSANEELDEKSISFLSELPDGRLCAGSRLGELYIIDPKTSSVSLMPFSKCGNVILYSMVRVGDEMWLGTNEGNYILSLVDGQETEISKDTQGHHSLSDDIVTSLFVDRDDNIWAGTMFGGATFIQRSGLIFERYSADNSLRGLSSNHIRGIAVDAQGMVWVGTEDSGLNILDPTTGVVKKVPTNTQNTTITLCLESIDDKIYAGFAEGGCLVMKGNTVIQNLGFGLLQTANDVYSIFKDASGNLWLGATWGLFRCDKGQTDFKLIEEVGYSWIYDLEQDANGTIWIASMGNSIWSYNPKNGKYTHYAYKEDHSNGLRSNCVSSILKDSKGRMWFSTDRGGLSLLNPVDGTFTTYGIESGLPDDTVYDVIEDSLGFLWFGTNKGLVRFNPETKNVDIFSGVHHQFNYHSSAKAADGRFYMGGIDGLLAFYPEKYDNSNKTAPIYFTNFKLKGLDSEKSGKGQALSSGILYADQIKLDADVGDFSLSIGSPMYKAHGDEIFVYRILPINDTWSVVSDPSNLSFVGLSPGNYTIEVKRIEDKEASCRLKIIILAPWYLSWWAKCVYFMLLIAMIGIGWAFYRKRQQRRYAERQEKFTIEKEKELYKKKMQFFTEIAHEIHTPLTLIGSPLEAIDEIGVKDERIDRYLKVIRQNTARLMNLTGQMLDFQKMDADSHPLKFEEVDINALIQNVVSRFELSISKRNKELVCNLTDRQVFAMVDREAVTKILSNLFNNAMKYSDRHIEISLETNDENFIVAVKSDGKKIAGDNRYKIFEPFYQAANKTDNGGVGIGLPLCRTLASLQGGTIELLDDNEENSNTFRLILPIDVKIEPVTETSPVVAEYVLEEESPVTSETPSYTLLLVDDNEEMRDFLYDQLSQDFAVETATDGKAALEKLHKHQFDMIITDIMMPEMDGYELCKAIKADPALSPTPVVFLTAKNDLESKVRALECGGEAYIEKPFSLKFFRQQIISLLDNRRHERKAFLNKPFFTVDNMKVNKADEDFMNKVMALIKDNIDNENFNVENMADQLCMSRSSLLRKIKALFSLSPVELIRLVRLKKAAELIHEGKYRMGDICFMVGINSQSYFTRLFLKQFGITPKAFENQCREKSNSTPIAENNNDISKFL